MKKIFDVSPELLALHERYIIEGKKPQYSWPLRGERNLNNDEIFALRNAISLAPRIGRIGSGRKRENELIAVPRGIINYIMSQLSEQECMVRVLRGEIIELKGRE